MSKRQRGLLGRGDGCRCVHRIGDYARQFERGILAQARAWGSDANPRPARGVEDRVRDRRRIDSFHGDYGT